jgi:hypothetical protein
MDPQRSEENRPTNDFPLYDEYNDEDYDNRYSLHTVGGNNPMMGESMDYQYSDANKEDSKKYSNN